VSSKEWLKARLAYLAAGKEFARKRNELSRQRRELPWERVEKNYAFDGPNSPETLAEPFAGRGQLIIYHFMLRPDVEQGCKSCSFVADHFDPILIHLAQRDGAFAVGSRAPLPRIAEFQKRMGWRFHGASAAASEFKRSYGVRFTKEELVGEANYNYHKVRFRSEDAPGFSMSIGTRRAKSVFVHNRLFPWHPSSCPPRAEKCNPGATFT